MSDEEFAESCKAAEERVKAMDEIDGRKDRELSTIHAALTAGLINPHTGAAFDALVMLRDLCDAVYRPTEDVDE